MKCLYLHGLGSNGLTNTAKGLRSLGVDVLSPSYTPHAYENALAMLKREISIFSPDLLIGTSMGGYFALKLAEESGLPVVAVVVAQ